MTETRLAWPKKNLNLWGLAKPGGVKIGPNTVDDKNSGRSSNDAKMHRKIVAQKETITEDFRNLSQAECESVMAMVREEFVALDYLSPMYGQRRNVLFYAKPNYPTLTLPMTVKGQYLPWTWEGLTVTFTEQ